MRTLILLVILVSISLLSASAYGEEQQSTIQLRILAPHMAHKIVLAAVNECTKRGFKVSAAVVDRNGNLAAFLRNPLSGPHTIEVSQRKAFSAASLQAATSQMASRTDLSFAPGILLIVGGVPINFGGVFYGGVAVAGAEVEVDEECAQAGLEAISETMEFAELM
jgi:uncharacterized protein GlcG (DUF336 family)